MSEKLTMPKNVQAFVDKYGRIGSKEQDAAFWKEFRKAANAYANVQAKRICDLEHALAEAREQRDRLAEALKYQKELNEWIESADPEDPFFDDGLRLGLNHASDLATEALQSLNQPEP